MPREAPEWTNVTLRARDGQRPRPSRSTRAARTPSRRWSSRSSPWPRRRARRRTPGNVLPRAPRSLPPSASRSATSWRRAQRPRGAGFPACPSMTSPPPAAPGAQPARCLLVPGRACAGHTPEEGSDALRLGRVGGFQVAQGIHQPAAAALVAHGVQAPLTDLYRPEPRVDLKVRECKGTPGPARLLGRRARSHGAGNATLMGDELDGFCGRLPARRRKLS